MEKIADEKCIRTTCYDKLIIRAVDFSRSTIFL
jgi:hypothetical protein